MEHTYCKLVNGEYIFEDDLEKRKRTEAAVKEINKLSNLPCKFLKAETRQLDKYFIDKGYEEIDNYMSNDYLSKEVDVICSGYPHDEARFKVTEMRLKTDMFDILGIKVGMIIEEAEKVLEIYQYEKNQENLWIKDDVIISIDGKSFIENLRIEVKTFYLGNRVY